MKSKDGLLSTTNPNNFKHVELYNQICNEQEENKRLWIEELRKQGFKAAHPNDGWVNRNRNLVLLNYPQFDDGVEIGDKIMLGFSKGDSERPVRVIDTISSKFSDDVYYKFEDIE